MSWRAPWTVTPPDPCSSAARIPSSVVSQLPTRPLITMFARRRTQDWRKRIARAPTKPNRSITSSVAGTAENLRIVEGVRTGLL